MSGNDEYIRNRVEELPEDRRVLITAHDAFQYFGNGYGFQVRGLQGISTDAEAGTSDIRNLADFIVEREIGAIFVESSVPARNIEALQEAVKARGFDVKIGGELYSDSTGSLGREAETYIGTVKHNIGTIVDALLGIVSGVLGNFAVIRKESLLGDAVSHAALPGIALAFLFTQSKNTEILLLGALISGLLATFLILGISKYSRIKFDSALALILSVFFGAGLVLLTYIQKTPNADQAGLSTFIFGQASTLLLRDVKIMATLGIVLLSLVILFWKEFKIVSFDAAFAESLGFNTRLITILLSALIVIAIIVAVACSLPGVFLVLRKMAMMTDAITHTVLLGIVIAFFITHDLSSPLLIVGSALMGVLTVFLIELLNSTKLVSEDSAIGVVFPLLFSIAIIIITRFAGNVHLDTDAVLLGELAYAPFNRLYLFGRDLGPKAIYSMGTILLINLIFIVLFFKELKIVTFDPALATILGFSPPIIHYTLMTLVSVTAVGALNGVL